MKPIQLKRLVIGVLAWCHAVAAHAQAASSDSALESVPDKPTTAQPSLSKPELAPAPSAKPVVFSHKDWELACDNTRTCRAVGYHRDADSEKPLALLLEREAGAATVVSAKLMLGHYGDGNPPRPSRLNLVVNGRSLGGVAMDKKSGTGKLSADLTAALLAVLPKASEVQFVSGKDVWLLSGDGVAAVLLKMDEAQGRLGTSTALVKKGNATDDRVLPPLPVPVVQMGVIDTSKPIDKRVASAIKPLLTGGKVIACEELNEALANSGTAYVLEIWRISATKLLVSHVCWRGAYNMGFGYWLVNDKPPYQPQLITESGSGYKNGLIDATHKDRGLGDCWRSEEWVWNGVGFTHTSASTTGMCKSVAAGGAWSLPTLVTSVIPAAK